MTKHKASAADAKGASDLLAKHRDLKHLRVRHRADVLTIESGPHDDPISHARLRRAAANLWGLEMPTHTGRWEPVPVRGAIEGVIATLVDDFGWTLECVT